MLNGPPDTFRNDPVLQLLPEVPDSFRGLAPDEQAWRGRAFLVAYGTGYAIDFAWWWALTAGADERSMISDVPDAEIPKMVKGRVDFDTEMERQAALGGQ